MLSIMHRPVMKAGSFQLSGLLQTPVTSPEGTEFACVFTGQASRTREEQTCTVSQAPFFLLPRAAIGPSRRLASGVFSHRAGKSLWDWAPVCVLFSCFVGD